MPDVFLSYSRRDIEFMRRVRNYLSSIGITVWTDESLEPGTPTWTFAIDQEIRRASAMVVVLSPDAKASPWVENEVALAQTCGTRIFPLLARGDESTAISFRLIAYQYVDARTDAGDAFSRLASALQRHLGASTGPAASPPPASPPPAASPPPSSARPAGGSVPAAPPGAPVKVVARTGAADFRTIADAIRQSPEGTVIRVRPGLYRENLVFSKAVELVGEGRREDIILESTTGNCIRMDTDYAVVSGMTIRLRVGDSGAQYFCVDVPTGRLVLDDCIITSDSLACVAAHGAGADPIIRGCRIHDGKAGGVFIYDDGAGLVENCDIFNNALAGIESRSGGNVTIRQSRIYDGKQGGIFISENGDGTIEDSDVFGNALAGIQVKGGTMTIRQCRLYQGKTSGVFVNDKGSALVEDCDIYGNTLAGVEVQSGGNPLVRNCRLHDGMAGGVLVYEDGLGEFDRCDVYGNALAGIEVRTGGNPTIRRCDIHEGRQGAILVSDKGKGLFEDCKIYDNSLAGVEIRTGGSPTIRRCKIYNGKQAGIFANDKGLGLIENCDIVDNLYAGVEIQGGANPTVRRCNINRNGYQAVWVYDNGQGTIENCDLTNNARGAWKIEGSSKVTRRSNTE